MVVVSFTFCLLQLSKREICFPRNPVLPLSEWLEVARGRLLGFCPVLPVSYQELGTIDVKGKSSH